MPATAPTVVTYALDDPAGVAVPNATVTAELVGPGDRSDDPAAVTRTSSTTTDSAGAFSLLLVPNAVLRAAGTYYRVTITQGPTYTIVVPISAAPVSLWDCRVDPFTLSPAALPAPIPYLLRAERGAPSGVASLDSDGLVPAGQLPVAGGGVPATRQIIAGIALAGGGQLTADLTLDVELGTTAGTAAAGNDARLSDARTPLAHAHSGADVTTGTVAAARLPVGTGAGTVAAGDDSRITGAVQATQVDAKGDLLAATAADTVARLPVGLAGQLLRAAPAAATGLAWSDGVVTLVPAGGSVATDAAAGESFEVPLTADLTLTEPTNARNGMAREWCFTQDATGGWEITLPTGAGGFKLSSQVTDTTPDPAPGAVSYLAARYRSASNRWHVLAFEPDA